MRLEPDVRDQVERHDFTRAADQGPREFVRSASPGAWEGNLSGDEQALIEGIMGPTMREFDYA